MEGAEGRCVEVLAALALDGQGQRRFFMEEGTIEVSDYDYWGSIISNYIQL